MLEPQEDDDVGGVDDVEAVLVDGHQHVGVPVRVCRISLNMLHIVRIRVQGDTSGRLQPLIVIVQDL